MVVGDCYQSCLVWGIASIYGGFPITISKPSFEGHRFCPLLFSRKSKIFRMSIPSSLRKVGCIPPTMTTFRKLSLICFSDLSSCSVFFQIAKRKLTGCRFCPAPYCIRSPLQVACVHLFHFCFSYFG